MNSTPWTVAAGDGVSRIAALGLLFVAFVTAIAFAPATSNAAVCTPPVVNQVACENSKPGTDPNTWQIAGAGDLTLQGFSTSMSVDRGQTISFKVKSANAYRVDILRLGYYRNTAITTPGTIIHDEYRMGATRSSVSLYN